MGAFKASSKVQYALEVSAGPTPSSIIVSQSRSESKRANLWSDMGRLSIGRISLDVQSLGDITRVCVMGETWHVTDVARLAT